MNLVPPPGRIVSGSIILDGVDVAKLSESELRSKIRWRKVSMVFQGAMNALTPVYTIGYQIAEPLIQHLGMTKREAMERAAELLEMVGLHRTMLNRYPHELSGGQKQRVVIATALALEPPLVIADEPTTALDVVVQAQILNLLKKLKREKNMSIILISHDLSVIAELADRIGIMYAGKLVEIGTAEQIFKNPQHPYTRLLLKSIPRLRGPVDKLEYIPGTPPDLRRPPPGCRFYPRCPMRMDVCNEEEPPVIEVEKGHYVACWLHAKR
jgi:peptide/nickel transport system ATP-binding protein